MWRLAGFLAMILVIVGVIFLAVQEHGRWTRWCNAQGGHVVDHTTTVTTFNSEGKPGVGSNTTYYCLNADGGIIDIED